MTTKKPVALVGTPVKKVNPVMAATMFVRNQTTVPSTARFVLMAIATRVDAQFACFPGRKKIATDTGLAPDTVGRAIKELEALGLIKVERARSANGNTYYKKIKLNVANDGKTVGVTDAESVAPGTVNDQGSSVTCTTSEDVTVQSGIQPEVEKTAAGLSATAVQELGKGQKGAGKKGLTSVSFVAMHKTGAPYVIQSADYAALRSLTWFILRRTEVGSRPILLASGEALHPPGADVCRLIDLSKLIFDYADGCRKSPKARVAFWHLAGRLCYPTLPRFSTRHRLTNCNSKELHSLFEALGPRACFVIAHAIETWDPNRSEQLDKYPYLETIVLNLNYFVDSWARLALQLDDHDEKVGNLLERLRL